MFGTELDYKLDTQHREQLREEAANYRLHSQQQPNAAQSTNKRGPHAPLLAKLGDVMENAGYNLKTRYSEEPNIKLNTAPAE